MVVIIYISLLCKGAIDSFEIEIRQPLNRLAAYPSRKCETTVKVQAVATWDLNFIDISVGWPGSMHDSRINRNSSLSQTIRSRPEGTDFFILGDTVRNNIIYFIEQSICKVFVNPCISSLSHTHEIRTRQYTKRACRNPSLSQFASSNAVPHHGPLASR